MITSRGFSIIELIMVIVITSIIASVGGFVIFQGVKSYTTAEAATPIANKGSAALSQLTIDLNNAVSFTSVGTQGMTFTNTSGETIVYAYSANTLTRQVNGGTARTVTDQLTALNFTYYTTALASTTIPASVRLVIIQMTLTGTVGPISLINSVYPRNAS